jgi:hypothetical protein
MPQLALIQLGAGLFVIAYGMQAIIFRDQNAQAFRPWVLYHPAVMVVLGLWAVAIGVVFVLTAFVRLLR